MQNPTRVPGQILAFNGLQGSVTSVMERLDKNNFSARLWKKDASLWKADEAHQKIIRNSLGWLTVAETIQGQWPDLERFAAEVKKDGFTDAVLLGMGGSSLAAEVFRQWLPAKPGFPKLHVLDSTDPGWVLSIEKSIQLSKTLFIVASKSGTTVEPHAFYSYFWEKTGKKGGQFIAITDPGSYLEQLAKERGFRKTFLNPSDIGGRFSALSLFGLVPAALAGMDVPKVLNSALAMAKACGPNATSGQNPAVQLGAAMGALAQAGRDKVTLLMPKPLEAFGLWIEQLVAESSGKEGKGIVPIACESLGKLEQYGADRFFVTLQMDGKLDSGVETLAAALKKAHPLAEIRVHEPEDLGGEMLRWEIAVSAACAALGVNTFDQPNVQEAKDLTKALLKERSAKGSLPALKTHLRGKGFEATFSAASLAAIQGGHASLSKNFVDAIKAGDYFGLLAFLPYDAETDRALSRLRTLLRDRTKASTLFGYGPRYLHSTGQLHKGGADNGVFVVITADPARDAKVPEQDFTFGQLEMAQAIGDFQALDAKGRRAVRLHLSQPLPQSIAEICAWIQEGTAGPVL